MHASSPKGPSGLRSRLMRTAISAVRLIVALPMLVWAATAAAVAPISVRDDAGRMVLLPHPAERIVSLAPHTTELLYEIAAGSLLVGATGYSDYPAPASRLPRVGGLAGIDIEAVVALHPDLVVAWRSGTAETQLARIEQLGIPVFRSEPQALEDIASTLTRFGTLTGHDAAAAAAAHAFRGRVVELREAYGTRSPVRVFYQVWRDPLITIGGRQMITQAIEICGGRNVFADLTTLAPQVDVEAVIRADPELIVTGSAGTDHRADLATWQRWSGVAAVRGSRYLFLDPALISRQSSRMLTGTGLLCQAVDAARKSSRIGSR